MNDVVKMVNRILGVYDRYKEKALTQRRFKQKDILPIITSLSSDPQFSITDVGASVEGKEIKMVQLGHGKTKILLWSQMHGNEPTATMAIMDLFNFFKTDDEFSSFKQEILENTTLFFVPMLNPDGADKFIRRNSLDIDLNRDALALQCPESIILHDLQQGLKPDFAFNLHDQDIRYAVGNTGKTSTIALLAPPFDESNSVNQVRERAMRVTATLAKFLEQYIPGQIGKWPDEYEPRAFGDTIQKSGASTILIEAGYKIGDIEKQDVRQLHFALLLYGFYSIAKKSYVKEDLKVYQDLPFNSKRFFDLIIRNAMVIKGGKNYKVDIGINRYEVEYEGGFYYKSKVEELGDMSTYLGFQEVDAEGLQAEPGKVSTAALQLDELSEEKISSLLKAGFTTVKVSHLQGHSEFVKLPINLTLDALSKKEQIQTESNADFILKEGDEARFVIVNGFLFDVKTGKNQIINGLIV